MKKTHLLLTVFAFILLIAALTNPKLEQHKEAVKNKLTEYMDQKVKDSNGLSSLFGRALIERAVDGMVRCDNYVFFSLTKISFQGQSKVIGMGLFGNVFMFGNVDDFGNCGAEVNAGVQILNVQVC